MKVGIVLFFTQLFLEDQSMEDENDGINTLAASTFIEIGSNIVILVLHNLKDHQ